MSTHLTVADLATFLRSRQADTCRVLADWVEDHPDDRRALAAVDRLEGFILNVANTVEMRHVALANADRIYNMPHLDSLRVGACLSLLASRYADSVSTSYPGWTVIVDAARYHAERRFPAWAATIVRELRQKLEG